MKPSACFAEGFYFIYHTPFGGDKNIQGEHVSKKPTVFLRKYNNNEPPARDIRRRMEKGRALDMADDVLLITNQEITCLVFCTFYDILKINVTAANPYIGEICATANIRKVW